MCLGIGLFSRFSLLRLLVYTMPFIAGNLIYSVLHVLVNIGRVASIAIIALACSVDCCAVTVSPSGPEEGCCTLGHYNGYHYRRVI